MSKIRDAFWREARARLGMGPTKAELRKEIDRLAGMLAEPDLLNMEIKSTIDSYQADITMRHWSAKLMAASFAESLDSAGAANFVTLDIGVPEHGYFEVTIRKRSGKSPAQIIGEMKGAIRFLHSLIRIFKLDLNEDENQAVADAYFLASEDPTPNPR